MTAALASFSSPSKRNVNSVTAVPGHGVHRPQQRAEAVGEHGEQEIARGALAG